MTPAAGTPQERASDAPSDATRRRLGPEPGSGVAGPAELIGRSALRSLPEKARQRLAAVAEQVELRPGGVLAREGDPADAMFVVSDGRVELRLHQRQRDLTLATLGSGDLVGWSWFVSPHRWAFDVVAPHGATLLRLPAAALSEMVNSDPVVGRAVAGLLVGVLSRRLRDTRVQLLDLFGESGPLEGGPSR